MAAERTPRITCDTATAESIERGVLENELDKKTF